MKLQSKTHGIIDYLLVLFLWLSPTLFLLPGTASIFIYGLGAVHLAITMLTNYDYGLVKVIPFKTHGFIELILSLLIVALSFYFGSMEGEFAGNYFLILGVVLFVFWLSSDYTNKPNDKSGIPIIESNMDGGLI